MIKTAAMWTAVALTVAGCAQHHWVPGPQVAGDYGRISGQCKLVAMGAAPSDTFVGVYGDPKFVAAAVGAHAIVNGIATAIQRVEVYNACMESAGFVAVENER